MSYNHRSAEKAWLKWKEAEEKRTASAGHGGKRDQAVAYIRLEYFQGGTEFQEVAVLVR